MAVQQEMTPRSELAWVTFAALEAEVVGLPVFRTVERLLIDRSQAQRKKVLLCQS